ncbi:hypothetical protein ACHAXS_003341 [Conticribra weissflogii]
MSNPQPAHLSYQADGNDSFLNRDHLVDCDVSASIQKSLPLNPDNDYYYYRRDAHAENDANFVRLQGGDCGSDSGNSDCSHEEIHYSDEDSVDHLSVLIGGDVGEFIVDDDGIENQSGVDLDGNNQSMGRNLRGKMACMQKKNECIDFNSSGYDSEERDYFADPTCTPSFDQN